MLVNEPDRFVKLVSKETFHDLQYIEKDSIGGGDKYILTHNKKKIICNSPVYIGFSVLDFAKDYVYRFYYDVLKKNYGDKVSLLYTDTDSYVLDL